MGQSHAERDFLRKVKRVGQKGKNLHWLRCRLPHQKWRKVKKVIEYRTCQGTERFVRMPDGCLMPEGMWEEGMLRAVLEEGLRWYASMGRRRGSIAGSVGDWRRWGNEAEAPGAGVYAEDSDRDSIVGVV